MKILKYPKKIFSLFILIPAICFSQEKNVIIRIAQGESASRLDDFQTDIVLKKKEFKFQVLLNHIGGVYVFASIGDSIYRFNETSPIRDFPYLKLLEIKEGDKFNSNKELNISETGWSYWFYSDSTEWNSFSRKPVGFGEKGIVCIKVIKQLYQTERGETMKLKNMNAPLYLFFVAVKDYDQSGKPLTELMRRKVKIEWTGED